MEQSKRKVIYLDDEEINLLLFKEMFKRDFDIYTTSSPQQAIDHIIDNELDIILTDQLMPVMTGVEFLQKLVEMKIQNLPRRVMISGYSQEGEVNQAIENGFLDKFVSKPWTYEGLKEVLETI